MTPLQAIVIVASGLGGLGLALSCLPIFRRADLAARLHPYLGSLGPRRSSLLVSDGSVSFEGIARVFRPLLEGAAGRLHSLLPDGQDLGARLSGAGWAMAPPAFRARQATWGLAAFGSALAGGLALVGSGRDVSPVALVLAAVLLAVGAVLVVERRLERAIEARRAVMLAEFPTVVDLICLGVTAGESVRGSIELVTDLGSGELPGELAAVLRATRTGMPLSEALTSCAARVGLAPFERFVGAVLTAQERGVPLADALRAMAFEVREAQRREVIESGGRKQISMLVPVVGLILPVALVFAFFPGVVAIRVLAQ